MLDSFDRTPFDFSPSSDELSVEPTSIYLSCTGYATCSMRTDHPEMVYITASNSIESEKVSADYICSGTLDEITIMQAYNENKHIENLTFLFSSGTFNFSRTIELKNINIVGQGPYKTIFQFIAPSTNPKNINNVSIGFVIKTTGTTSLENFSITANGTLKVVYDDATVFSDASHENKFILSNINATNYKYNSKIYYKNGTLGKIMVEVAYPVQTLQPTTIPLVNLEVSNCKVESTDYSGFIIYGDTNNDVLARAMKDIYFKNCRAIKCGTQNSLSVIAGFNMLNNITAENIRFQNCISNDNWHSGFYFDDARMRAYVAGRRRENTSNSVYNLYMDNCYAYNNGKRSRNKISANMEPYCSGFVFREFSMSDDRIESIPQFYSYDIDGSLIFQTQSYPSYLGGARGPYLATDPTKVAYGNIVNCIATGNVYAGYYSRGNKWNSAELTLLNCYASKSQRSLVISKHDGLKIVNFVSDGIESPAVTFNTISDIIVDRMRIDNMSDSQFITFTNIDEYENLMLIASRYIQAVS